MMKKLLSLLFLCLLSLTISQARADVYIIGSDTAFGEWCPDDGLEMDTDDNLVFTAEVSLAESTWFGFTTKLGEDANDWAGIKNYRMSAPSNDYNLNAHLGEDVQCNAPGVNVDNAFMLAAGDYLITFTLNTRILKVERMGDIEPTGHVYILGEVNGGIWAANDGVEMETEDESVFTADVEFRGEQDGYSYFSFTQKLSEEFDGWSEIAAYRFGAPGDMDYLITDEMMGEDIDLGEDGTSTAFKIAAGKYTLVVDLDFRTLTVTPQAPEVYVLGEVNDNGGWAADKGVKMTSDDGVTFTANITTKGEHDGYSYFSFTNRLALDKLDFESIEPYRFGAAGDYDFLVTPETTDTDIELTRENYKAFKIPAGEYELTLDLEDMTLVISGDVVPVIEDVYILGEVNYNGGWGADRGEMMETYDGRIYTLAITAAGEHGGYSRFSFSKAIGDGPDDWASLEGKRFGAVSDGDFWLTEEMVGKELSLTYDNFQAFRVPAGEYQLTLDLHRMKLVIEGEIQPVIANVYVMGEVNDNGGWAANAGTQMDTNEGVIYTATIVAAGEQDGYSYFNFSTALANDPEDWDYIAEDRFGAVSEGDFWVTENLMGKDLGLTFENYQTFKVNAGVYTLKLNLKKMKLIINHGVYCDVNGDGQVNVTDINLTVSDILNKTNCLLYDINGDGTVNVTDVNLIVSELLSAHN